MMIVIYCTRNKCDSSDMGLRIYHRNYNKIAMKNIKNKVKAGISGDDDDERVDIAT